MSQNHEFQQKVIDRSRRRAWPALNTLSILAGRNENKRLIESIKLMLPDFLIKRSHTAVRILTESGIFEPRGLILPKGRFHPIDDRSLINLALFLAFLVEVAQKNNDSARAVIERKIDKISQEIESLGRIVKELGGPAPHHLIKNLEEYRESTLAHIKLVHDPKEFSEMCTQFFLRYIPSTLPVSVLARWVEAILRFGNIPFANRENLVEVGKTNHK